MHNDLYSVLGLHKNATHRQIKTAYMKLALIHHPDRNIIDNNSDEFLFKKISEAYQVLSDPDKKKIYDLDLVFRDNSEFFMNIYYSVINFFTHPDIKKSFNPNEIQIPTQRTKSNPDPEKEIKKMTDINVEMSVTIDDLYLHKIKRIRVWVKRRISSDKTTHNEHQKIIKMRETVYVSLINYQPDYHFPNIGDDSSCTNIMRGDLIVNLVIKPHHLLRIDDLFNKYDLWIYVPITLYEYYFGTRIKLPYLGGECLDEMILWESKSDTLVHEIPNYGLPYLDPAGNFSRGSLWISCRIDLPSRIETNIDLDAIQSFLECHFNDSSMFGKAHTK